MSGKKVDNCELWAMESFKLKFIFDFESKNK